MRILNLFCCVSVIILFAFPSYAQHLHENEFKDVEFEYKEISGIGHEKGCTRRDPSDVIKVEDTWYVYYTKVFGQAPGYWGTLWYATSVDQGYSWEEQGEILGLGSEGAFDSQATFTPNILYAKGNYYLYYTGVKPTPGNQEGAFENNSTTDITAIGLAVSESPDGPFIRISEQPILKVSVESEKFDSYRIDDASLLFRNGLYWLYYKGRSRIHGPGGPGHTQMGVAYSKNPEGPFIKLGEPLLAKSHEVMIWPQGSGVAALASISSTVEYAGDGVDFTSRPKSTKVKNRPNAPGAFRPDLTNPHTSKGSLEWGISMIHNGSEAYLIRYELTNRAKYRGAPRSYDMAGTIEIPYIKGESGQIFDAKPSSDFDDAKWFTNDHCFITDKDGQLHWFGINNPYPPEGKELYRYHPYLGHLKSDAARTDWERLPMALDESKGTEYVGAPYIIWHEESQRYAMVVEVWPDQRELEVYWSDDLNNWKASGVYLTGNVWKSSRDPHILKGPDGKYWIHVVSHGVEGKKRSQIIRWKTKDFVNFEPATEVLGIDDNNWATLIESPFLIERKGLWYMFFTYAHRRYTETLVVVSDDPDYFDYEKNTVTTLFGHAAEIFEYKGKRYISSCGPEDEHFLNHQSVSLAELGWFSPVRE